MIVRIQGEAEKQSGIYYTYDTDSIPLGEGGMGIVYDGYCIKEENENEYIPVAIKLITNTTKEVIDRAITEATIQITHPNLLRIYGFIPNMELDPLTMTYKPRYYVIMEKIVGVNLDSLLTGIVTGKTNDPIPFAQELLDMYHNERIRFAREVMTEILKGVSFLHASGYIHRDLDPSNVMITEDRQIKIIDYGISKPISEFNTRNHKQTQHGAIIGKIDYAAPEIVTGDVEHHNVTTDIYALGIILFQFYTGFLPFQGDNNHIMQAHLTQKLPLRNIDDIGIRRIVEKATQKNQEDRYQSADAMLEDLNNLNTSANPINRKKTHKHKSQNQTNVLTWVITILVGTIIGVIMAFFL